MKFIEQPCQQQQGGGIIINRAKILLIAVTEPTFYNALSAATKAQVDAVDAKDPASRTQADCDTLIAALGEANGC